MMQTKRVLLALIAIATATAMAGCGDGDKVKVEVIEGYGVKIVESEIKAAIDGEAMDVTFVLRRTGEAGSGKLPGNLKVQLFKLGKDHTQSENSEPFDLDAAHESVTVTLGAPQVTSQGELGGYALRYFVELPEGQLFGRRSLYMAVMHTGLVVLGNNRFAEGEKGVLRVISVEPGGKGIEGTLVTVTFSSDTTGKTRTLASGQTNALGELEAVFVPTAEEIGGGTIRVRAGHHESSHSVLVEREHQILLTTDKPLYQPGQTVHIRALAMKQPKVVPLADEELLLEVEDPQGNKLFKKQTQTDAHGIAALRFDLARLVGLGRYTARVTMGTTVREKTFKVDRYTLPKFKVQVGFNQPYFKPGNTVSGWVQADYFFNKHVKAGAVKLTVLAPPSTKVVQEILGKTDDTGRYSFQLKAPTYGEQLQVLAAVTDVAGAEAHGHAGALLTHDKVVLQLVPERKVYIQGQDNTYFVMLSDPAGKPLSGTVQILHSTLGTLAQVTVPASGVATFKLARQECLGAINARHGGVETSLHPNCTQAGQVLALSADKALYKEGENATITLHGPAVASGAKLELVRGNITVATHPVKLDASGSGTLELQLSGDLRRTLELKASALVDDQVVTDRKLIYVQGADQLSITVTGDKKSYRPAESATITLQMTDQQGKAAPGAMGVQVVDEALYALTEFKPGLERRFFFLEQEAVDAGESLKFVSPQVMLSDKLTATEQIKARMLFAAAENKPSYPINHRSADGDLPAAIDASKAGIDAMNTEMSEALAEIWDSADPPPELAVKGWVKKWLAPRMDDFGQAYGYDVGWEEDEYWISCAITVRSAGMDEAWETEDDLVAYLYLSGSKGTDPHYYPAMDGSAAFDAGFWAADATAMADAGMPPPGGDGGTGQDSGGSSGPQIRQYFPETLYVNPALITDSQGKATIDLTLADSITTWRLSTIGHTAAGQLGSTMAPITVFQEFFIDTLLPENFLQNDEVEVPVAVYNYLGSDQQVTVTVKSEPWFDLIDTSQKTITVPAKSVSSATFRIRVKQVGTFGFTATGVSATDSDGVKRSVRVLPDGQRHEIVESGVLKPGTTSHTITIPQAAIDGATELFVKVFPGVLAEVVEGFESLLREPSGCFEQTSSTTYPNVMVAKYLGDSGLSNPQLEKKAQAYIERGYQRLLTYEVSGGGFSLWGDPPANLVLSAFGLMEFSDMAKVRFVDKELINRTQTFLIASQDANGSFAPPSYSYYEIPGNVAKDTLRTTAYVAWALHNSGYAGSPLTSALSYVKAQVNNSDDTYTQAVAANALLSVSSSDPVGLSLLDKLKKKAIVDATTAHWESAGCSMTYGYGDSMTIETTALVAGALLLAKQSGPVTGKAIHYLTTNKSGYGGYGTTQATVLALRALILSLENQGGNNASGTIQVLHNSVQQSTTTVSPATSDVTRYFDLKQAVLEGDNKVEIDFTGSGELAYQVVGIYYLPHGTTPSVGPLAFDVSYDKSVLKVNESIQVTAKVDNTAATGSIPTVMVRVGLPPGFTVDLKQLTPAATNKIVQNAEKDTPFVNLYLGDLEAGVPQQVSFDITATLAVTAKAPASMAYPYYTPEYIQLAETPVVTVTQ